MDAVYAAMLICAVIAILTILLSIPLYLQKIKRNYYYGLLTIKTLSSDEIWLSANRDSAFYYMVAGVVVLVTVFGLFLLRSTLEAPTLLGIMIFVAIVSFVGATIKSFIALRKY